MLPNIPAIQNPEKYSEFRIPKEKLEHALEVSLKQINKCIECGFCEVNCVSCGFTLSSRTRIALQREMARLEEIGEDSH